LVFLPWQCLPGKKQNDLAFHIFYVMWFLFFPPNSIDSIKGKEMVDEWYLYDASTITESSDQIWNCVLYEALWIAVWSLVLLRKVSRRLLGRGPHCLELKCCCFGEISLWVIWLHHIFVITAYQFV
jgi:hypothetical protein